MKILIIAALIHLSTLIFFSYKEYLKTKTLYSVLIATTTHNGLHLLHVSFLALLVYMISKIFIYYFLNNLRNEEINRVNDQTFMFLTDILLILTIFSDDLNIKNLFLFSILLAIKCLTWIYHERVQYEQNKNVMTMGILLLSFSFSCFIICLLNSLEAPSIQILFAFEYGMIFLSTTRSLGILLVDFLILGDKKRILTFYIDIVYAWLKLMAFFVFFFYTSLSFRIPFNIFREAIQTFRSLLKKIKNLKNYKIISKMLNECEIVNSMTCPICQEEMVEGRRVICGHAFHMECIKRWVEQQQVCPICRQSLFKESNIPDFEGIPVNLSE